MINFYNVTKLYPNGVRALNDVSLRICKGEFVFIVGPSGAGKSSLIKIIFREELPTRGQVLFGGKNVARLRGREIPYLRRKIGMVFQDFKLLPGKMVSENVAFAMEVTGASSKDIKKRVPQVLEQVGLKDKLNVRITELSGGEQQRVCIARALVNKPMVLIADEPTGNLDPDTAWDLMQLLSDINKDGTTVIMSTHAREIVNEMKRRVIAISEGKIARDEECGVYCNEL